VWVCCVSLRSRARIADHVGRYRGGVVPRRGTSAGAWCVGGMQGVEWGRCAAGRPVRLP
jgi:hypothetical protein